VYNRLPLLSGWALLAFLSPAAAADPGDSVVRVLSSVRYPNPIRPWAKGNSVDLFGTGTVIEGNRILTSAHLVLYATEVHVQPRRGGDRTEAQVEAIAPDMDLAVLTVKDEKFYQRQPALARAKKLPRVQDPVAVHGFPVGGNDLAVTKGVVSRIDFTRYDQQGYGLIIQVSAAVNPGNSGGPGVVGDEMIGIVRSRSAEGENIGYIVPNEEIDAFLEDIRDGRYDGKPVEGSGAWFQRLENDALRSFLGLDRGTRGIMVSPSRRGGSDGPLQPFDVLTKIGDYAIDNDGMVQVGNDLRVSFYGVIPRLAKAGAVPVTVLRHGKPLDLSLPVSRTDNRLIREFRGEMPSYFIHGPLVFSPAKAEAIPLYARLRPVLEFDDSPLLTRQFDRVRFAGEELVVVTSPLLAHKIARGYENPVGQVVREVNGVAVRNLRHLVELLRDSKDEYLTFRFAERSAEVLVFRRAEMEKATEEILEDNGISGSRRGSADMLKVWKRERAAAR
jgi:S1-C subfamily serine protease